MYNVLIAYVLSKHYKINAIFLTGNCDRQALSHNFRPTFGLHTKICDRVFVFFDQMLNQKLNRWAYCDRSIRKGQQVKGQKIVWLEEFPRLIQIVIVMLKGQQIKILISISKGCIIVWLGEFPPLIHKALWPMRWMNEYWWLCLCHKEENVQMLLGSRRISTLFIVIH